MKSLIQRIARDCLGHWRKTGNRYHVLDLRPAEPKLINIEPTQLHAYQPVISSIARNPDATVAIVEVCTTTTLISKVKGIQA